MVATLSSIAIFILSTIQPPSPLKSQYHLPNNFDLRLAPIHETWGSYLTSTFFVLGRNKPDYDFIQYHCMQKVISASTLHVDVESENRRVLVPKVKQIESKDTMELHHCPSRTPIRNNKLPLKVLVSRNCTGEYFGMGPTCRCQESMRFYFLSLSKYYQYDW